MKWALVIALVAIATPAHAQVPVADEPAFSVERFTPAPGRAGGVVEEADVLPRWQWAASVWTSLMARPIVLRDLTTDEEVSTPVAWRLGFEASGAIGLGKRYQLGLAIPWGVQGGDRLQGIGVSNRALQRAVLGDLRLHGRARITGAPGDRGLGAALSGTLVLPTGDDGDFAGEAGTMLDWKLAFGWRNARVAVAANLGVRLRTREVVLFSPARPHGNEVLTGAAGAVEVLRWMSAIGEAVWAIGDAPKGTRGPSPGEVRGGLRVRAGGGWSLTALAGAGITPGDVGSPAWRVVLGVGHDRAPVDDTDGDGVIDGRDRCRRAAEDRDGFADSDGCPDPDDDGDGLRDDADECPREPEDPDGYRDVDGCPDAETWTTPMPTGDFPPPLPDWIIPEADPPTTSR